MKPLDILNDLIKNKKIDIEKSDLWGDGDRKQRSFNNPKILSYEELKKEAGVPLSVYPNWIPQELYNKQFNIGDFTIIVQFDNSYRSEEHPYTDTLSRGYMGEYFSEYVQWNIILKYHGAYLNAYKYEVSASNSVGNCKPTQTNWFHLKPTIEQPYIIQSGNSNLQTTYEGFKRIKEFLAILDVNSLQLEKQTLDFVNPNYYYEKEHGKSKPLYKYSAAEMDFKWFVSSEVKKGVYTPEAATIKHFLYAWTENIWFAKKKKIAKDVLHELGIKNVQLRSDAHFNLEDLFDIKGVSIKAPQKIIENYGYEKKTDSKVADKIAADKAQAEKDAKLLAYNKQFTLVQHGKTILENVDISIVKQYLENFSVSKTNYEDVIIASVKPIFDRYPDINKYAIAAWGTYYKYESAGESYFHGDDLNNHIDEDTLNDIDQLYVGNIVVDEDATLIKYGRSERGGTKLFVSKDSKGKLKLETESYDPE